MGDLRHLGDAANPTTNKVRPSNTKLARRIARSKIPDLQNTALDVRPRPNVIIMAMACSASRRWPALQGGGGHRAVQQLGTC